MAFTHPSVRFQESPLHNARTLDALLGMAKKTGRREAQMALETLKDLFLTNLLPRDRALRAFSAQRLTHPGVTDAALIAWRFEDDLKGRFGALVSALAEGCDNSLLFYKCVCMKYVSDLIAGTAEARPALLSVLINKLGDPDRKARARRGAVVVCVGWGGGGRH